MKTCKTCQREFAKPAKESRKQHEGRKYCSTECSQAPLRGVRKPSAEIQTKYRFARGPDGRTMLEHRLVMEQYLGRKLGPHEEVHHINSNRLDNRIENLSVVTRAEHSRLHATHPLSRDCVICGRNFSPHKAGRNKVQSCSPKCRGALQSLNSKQAAAALTHMLNNRTETP